VVQEMTGEFRAFKSGIDALEHIRKIDVSKK
jgi:hypothetical protein